MCGGWCEVRVVEQEVELFCCCTLTAGGGSECSCVTVGTVDGRPAVRAVGCWCDLPTTSTAMHGPLLMSLTRCVTSLSP